MVNHYFDTFNHLKSFDLVSYDELISLYMKNHNLLGRMGFDKQGGKNERPINSEIDKLDDSKPWKGYNPAYYDLSDSRQMGSVVMAKADVISMDFIGLGKDFSHFIYLEIPCEIINQHMIATHDNSDVSIARKFINEVESTKDKWRAINDVEKFPQWHKIRDKYDKKYNETSQYTDYYETHTELKWRQDIDFNQYITIKQNGLIYPICYNNSYFMFKRGTHRIILLAQTGSDIPIFLQYPSLDLNKHINYDVDTPKYFNNNESLKMNVDTKTKKLTFTIGNFEV